MVPQGKPGGNAGHSGKPSHFYIESGQNTSYAAKQRAKGRVSSLPARSQGVGLPQFPIEAGSWCLLGKPSGNLV